MLEAADEIYAALPEDQRQLLMAYADGVNAGAKRIPKHLSTPSFRTTLSLGNPGFHLCPANDVGRASIERRMELVRGVVSDLGPEALRVLGPRSIPLGRSH